MFLARPHVSLTLDIVPVYVASAKPGVPFPAPPFLIRIPSPWLRTWRPPKKINADLIGITTTRPPPHPPINTEHPDLIE